MDNDKQKQETSKSNEKKADTPDVPAPPDGGWGWMVVLSSFMISVLVDGVCFSQGIFFNRFKEHFNTNKAMTSWIGSVLNGSYLIIGPFVSMLVNKFGCRPVAVAGAVLAWVSIFVSTYAPNIQVFTFLYSFLGGTGFGLMYLPAIVMVGYYFDKRRARATGIACCGSGIGMFVFAPLSEFLLGEYNWRGATWVLSGLVVNGAIFSMFYRPLPVGNTETERDDRSEIQMEEIVPKPNTSVSDKYEIVNGKLAQPVIKRTRSFEMNLDKANQHSEIVKGESDVARLAHSHDALHSYQKHGTEHSHKPHYLHPLERKDIFYSGSIRNLKEFTEAGSTSEFTKAMMRSQQSLHSRQDIEEEAPSCCARVARVFLSLFDVSLLKSPTFLVYGLSCFLCMLGFFIPFTYIPPLAVDLNISLKDAAFLISIIGITNTVSRVAVGFISDQPWADCLLINNLALIIAGVVTILVPYYPNYGLLAAYVAVFGIGIAVFVSLRSILMVELMGLERLTSAFGLVIMCQGLSSYIGAPIAGSIADIFGNYNAAFYLSGAALALAGIICLPLRKVAAWEKAREKRRKTPAEEPML